MLEAVAALAAFAVLPAAFTSCNDDDEGGVGSSATSALTAVSGGRAELVMNHVMAKVAVHLTDVTGNYDLTTLSMTLPSRLTTVNADIAQGTASTVEGITADITPYQPDNTPRLTAETEVTESNNNPIYQSADADVFNRVNAAIEALGLESVLLTDGSTVYVTSTEYNTETHDNFWCLQTLTSNGAWNWAFGHNPQRGSSSGRSLIPCAAVTLPAAL